MLNLHLGSAVLPRVQFPDVPSSLKSHLEARLSLPVLHQHKAATLAAQGDGAGLALTAGLGLAEFVHICWAADWVSDLVLMQRQAVYCHPFEIP